MKRAIAGFLAFVCIASYATTVVYPLIATKGGTGFASYTVGDMLYASSTTALSKRAAGLAGNALLMSGGVPTWGQLNLSSANAITGIAPVANGGSGASNFNTPGFLYSDGLNVQLYSAASTPNATRNSALDMWQRGATFAITATSAMKTADGWTTWWNACGTCAATVTRQTDVPTAIGVQYSMKVLRDNGNANTSGLITTQTIGLQEARPFSGKTVVFSFYAKKGANFTPTSDALLFRLDSASSDLAPDSASWTSGGICSGTATLTTSWQRFSCTGTVASDLALRPVFRADNVGTAGADDSYYVTGVQVNAGSIVMPYQRMFANRDLERLFMFTFYQKRGFSESTAPAQNLGVSGDTICYTAAGSASRREHVYFSPPMRASATAVYYNPSATNSNWRNVNDGADSGASGTGLSGGGVGLGVDNAAVAGDGAGERVCINAAFDAEY